MTPSEKSVVKSLIAVAWADGQVQGSELGVIEGLLCSFDATADEEVEILGYARVPRTLTQDIPVEQFSDEERELLLTNAALLTLADRTRSPQEIRVLGELAELLGFESDEAQSLIAEACAGLDASTLPPAREQ
jgi:uncharacterized membrane protein YebE (DUF533 family)